MYFVKTLVAALAVSPFAALAAKEPADRFSAALAKSYPLKLDDAKYPALISAPRDYAVVVILTALDRRFGCQICHDFHPEWELLAKSWQRGDRKGESRTVFATLDFADGKDTFASLGLQHAPVVMLYPPTQGLNAKASSSPVRFDFSGYVVIIR
jgi:oligosaccharyltransferase complex subunit gamma